MARKDHARTRLARIVRLRKMGAPLWVIKSEQVAMVLNRMGLRHVGIGKSMSKTQAELYDRYVSPHMAG